MSKNKPLKTSRFNKSKKTRMGARNHHSICRVRGSLSRKGRVKQTGSD